MTMHWYSVWHDNQEQWDPDDIDKPALRCQTQTAVAAAERLAEQDDNHYGKFIVRDDDLVQYRFVELRREWSVVRDAPTTLDDLCSP